MLDPVLKGARNNLVASLVVAFFVVPFLAVLFVPVAITVELGAILLEAAAALAAVLAGGTLLTLLSGGGLPTFGGALAGAARLLRRASRATLCGTLLRRLFRGGSRGRGAPPGAPAD